MRYNFLCKDTAATEIFTLSLHDALPISLGHARGRLRAARRRVALPTRPLRQGPRGGLAARARLHRPDPVAGDRKSTRLNSSHANTSYDVFCLKTKYILLFHPVNWR